LNDLFLLIRSLLSSTQTLSSIILLFTNTQPLESNLHWFIFRIFLLFFPPKLYFSFTMFIPFSQIISLYSLLVYFSMKIKFLRWVEPFILPNKSTTFLDRMKNLSHLGFIQFNIWLVSSFQCIEITLESYCWVTAVVSQRINLRRKRFIQKT